MASGQPPQVIQVGSHQITLPAGVTADQWGFERTARQNPRIRAFLGSIRLLEGVLESNYAILHCSPERLLDIWGKVREVSRLLNEDLAPLLEEPSCIPRLDEARRAARVSLTILQDQVLKQLQRFPADPPPDRLLELRKLLCVSIGQIHAFLQDTFGELMASDPRSVHDADYFLSRRFPRDIEEAEWLHATVRRLQEFMHRVMDARPDDLSRIAERMTRRSHLPGEVSWRKLAAFVDLLLRELVPKLHEVLALRGIRFDELEVVDRYAAEVPLLCREILALYEIAGDFLDVLETEADTEACQRILGHRMAERVREIDERLHDLVSFLPLWLTGIEKRRALMFQRRDVMGSGPDGA